MSQFTRRIEYSNIYLGKTIKNWNKKSDIRHSFLVEISNAVD